ncbi:MAG: helix-turn-helix transcriptional regulator, partial [Clostridia bacterium]|nr:helix-turn-helix transcriptional regulator [Clostridia bacterium]
KGEIIATAGDRDLPLRSGEMLFHQPNEWHNIRANGTIAPNVMVISFRCQSPDMTTFVERRMKIGTGQRELLSRILSESRRAFSSSLDNPYDNSLVRRRPSILGSEQLIELYLTELLISLLRQCERPVTVDHKTGSHPLLDDIVLYMQQHIGEKLTLEQLARHFHVSRSHIKTLFAQYKQTGAMHFFIDMKIRCAKDYLRESDYNISQIAELLGYDNVYYFCNQFKQAVNMSPLEYRRSVKAIGDKAKDLL